MSCESPMNVQHRSARETGLKRSTRHRRWPGRSGRPPGPARSAVRVAHYTWRLCRNRPVYAYAAGPDHPRRLGREPHRPTTPSTRQDRVAARPDARGRPVCGGAVDVHQDLGRGRRPSRGNHGQLGGRAPEHRQQGASSTRNRWRSPRRAGPGLAAKRRNCTATHTIVEEPSGAPGLRRLACTCSASLPTPACTDCSRTRTRSWNCAKKPEALDVAIHLFMDGRHGPVHRARVRARSRPVAGAWASRVRRRSSRR